VENRPPRPLSKKKKNTTPTWPPARAPSAAARRRALPVEVTLCVNLRVRLRALSNYLGSPLSLVSRLGFLSWAPGGDDWASGGAIRPRLPRRALCRRRVPTRRTIKLFGDNGPKAFSRSVQAFGQAKPSTNGNIPRNVP